VAPNILNKYSAFLFKGQTLVLVRLLDPEYKGTKFLQNIRNCSLDDTVTSQKNRVHNKQVTPMKIYLISTMTLM
jgi:hypothetical protein